MNEQTAMRFGPPSPRFSGSTSEPDKPFATLTIQSGPKFPDAPVESGEFPDYDRYLKLINDAQRYKLRINAHKGDLGEKPVAELFTLMKRELAELEEAISRGSEIEMILEVADISNFAMGIVVSAVRKLNSWA